MSWSEYVKGVAGQAVNSEVAEKVGVTEPVVSRWKSGVTKTPNALHASSLARAYGRPVLEAFIAAGFLTEAEAKVRPQTAPRFDQLTNDELLELVRARMGEEGEGHGDRPAATKMPGSRPVKRVSGPRLLPTAALDTGKLSRGQQDRANADLAGEPQADDPDDMEPR